MRYFIQLSYNGKNYHGWQIQPNACTVQEVLEKSFSIILKEKIEITGAGRTDTGVHAEYYIAHFDVLSEILNIEKLIFRLNCFLPIDISIQKIFSVENDLHARFSAISRTYQYRITLKKDVFLNDFLYFTSSKLDLEKMNKASEILFDYEDFTSFSKLHSDNKTNNCKIMKAYWNLHENQIIFTIQADRFLRNMVRAIVGTIIEIGRGKIEIVDLKTIIESKNRSNAGFSVPAHGLFLTDVEYNFNNR